jgi:hypothetical protein
MNNIAAAFFFIFALVIPQSAFAQSVVSFNVSPTTIEEKVLPGDSLDLTLKIENRGDIEATLRPVARNITGMGSDYRPVYASGENADEYELASWITYQESGLVLRPGEKKDLRFRVAFPNDARPGSHLAAIFLTQGPPEDVKQGSAIGFEIGSILHFQIKGEIKEDTRIRGFITDKTIYGTPDVKFTVRVENQGNTLSRPQGQIEIMDMFGKKIAQVKVNEDAKAVFPNDSREYLAEWKEEGFAIGRYEAVLALVVPLVEGGNQTISSVIQFWVLPSNVLLPVFGGLFGFLLILYISVRLYIRSQLKGVTGRREVRAASGISRLTAIALALLFAIVLGMLILLFYYG